MGYYPPAKPIAQDQLWISAWPRPVAPAAQTLHQHAYIGKNTFMFLGALPVEKLVKYPNTENYNYMLVHLCRQNMIQTGAADNTLLWIGSNYMKNEAVELSIAQDRELVGRAYMGYPNDLLQNLTIGHLGRVSIEVYVLIPMAIFDWYPSNKILRFWPESRAWVPLIMTSVATNSNQNIWIQGDCYQKTELSAWRATKNQRMSHEIYTEVRKCVEFLDLGGN